MDEDVYFSKVRPSGREQDKEMRGKKGEGEKKSEGGEKRRQ